VELNELQKHWDGFGKVDPLYAILTIPTKIGGQWNIEEFFRTGEVEVSQLMELAGSLKANLSRHKALDFGCGVGRVTQALCHHFDQCYGVDIAPSMIQLAQEYNRVVDRCQYYLNESDNLRLFADNTFDFIYCSLVLQHMQPEYSKNYIREFIRVLAPDGLLIFQLPSAPVTNGALADLHGSIFRAQITLMNPPRAMKAGAQATLRVRVKNVSDTTWPAFGAADNQRPIRLGNHWLDSSWQTLVRDDGRASLPRDVKPLDEIELDLTVTVPKAPGDYILELDIVQEGIAWFQEKGSATAMATVTVTGSRFQLKRFRDQLLRAVHRRPIHVPPNAEPVSEGFVPRMEMWGVAKHEVMALIDVCGGTIVGVHQDGKAGRAWWSFTYGVTK
jgi:SAM-dependent methyltransferase